MLRRLAFVWLVLASCGDEDPPAQGTPDTGVVGPVLCDLATPCPSGFSCSGGVCEPSGGADAAGFPDAAELTAALEICTPDGCVAPHRVSFGGSRIGVPTTRTLRVRSTGTAQLIIRNIEVNGQQSEFTVDPSGDLDLRLDPGEEEAIRVTHQATDGQADTDRVVITSNAVTARVQVEVFTEYKGVPSLFVGAGPNDPVGATVVDFGNVRAGVRESRRVYLQNRDVIVDGSVLGVSELRLDPQSSTNFTVVSDAMLPAFLNQFNARCVNSAQCASNAGDTCDAALGVCRTAGGSLRDVLTATVTFIGSAPGMVEEGLVVLSNDTGQPNQSRRVTVRANVVTANLDVTPDPINLVGYVGYPVTQTVTLTNAGTADLTVRTASLSGGMDLGLELGALALPSTIVGMDSRTVTIRFTPTMAGEQRATLTIVSDDLSMPSQNVRVIANAAIAPQLILEPTGLDFGDVHYGVTAAIAVRVRNTGGSPLMLSQLVTTATTSPSFTIDAQQLGPIAPGGELTFNARYTPLSPRFPAFDGGAISITSNDPRPTAQVRMGLRGRAIDPNAVLFPPPPFSFNSPFLMNPNAPSIYVGQVVNFETTLSNNSGFGPLIVSSLTIANDPMSNFAVLAPPPTPFTIDPRMSLTLTIQYTSRRVGSDGAELRIVTNDVDVGGNGTLVAGLTGTAVACPSRPNSTGLADAAGTCTYACAGNFYDLDGLTQNGCEYACTLVSMNDVPDDGFADANCDGIDGRSDQAVFVAAAPFGSDVAGPGRGTQALPYATIQNALLAANATRNALYISQGTYVGPITLLEGVSLYGGYDATDRWSRATDHTSTILSSQPTTIIADAIDSARTVLDRLQILSGDGQNAGESSMAVLVTNSTSFLEIRNCNIVAGNGAAGTAGTRGGNGSGGSIGNTGNPGCSGCGTLGAGGGGGFSFCGTTGGTGGTGAYDGNQGSTGGGFGGGLGGLGAECCSSGACNDCSCTRTRGRDGNTGSGGSSGSSGGGGSGGAGSGRIAGGLWFGANGAGGNSGGAGVGGAGGGGGGGGNDSCNTEVIFCVRTNSCNSDAGGGGGGGGGGGCGGNGGSPGTGAGGSFGIFLSSSTPIVINNTIRSGNGGRGGNGGDGGDGGGGGAGAAGGGGRDDSGGGASGGAGGTGGRGGGGGGGGGGVSYAIYRAGSSAGAQLVNNILTAGAGGAGGSGGLPSGIGGTTGLTGTTF